jgi:hypothetical protein
MSAEQSPMATSDKVEAGGEAAVCKAEAARPGKGRRGPVAWVLACLGGGLLPLAGLLAWGCWELGSLANVLAYVQGERLLVDPATCLFGTAPRGEERELHATIRNKTDRTIQILGARMNCTCMTTDEFPVSIAPGGRHDLTIRVFLGGKEPPFEKRIDYYTDCDAKPSLAVLVRGQIAD